MSEDVPYLKSVCVYCGASNKVEGRYKDCAITLGKGLAENNMHLVYGGGDVGLMGLIATAVMDHGGTVTGIIPEHLRQREVQNEKITELIVVDHMHPRKRLMIEKSDAFVVLPGGIGTLDETFESLTWKSLGLHEKPIFFLNLDDYWDPVFDMLRHMEKHGFLHTPVWQLFDVVDDVDSLIGILSSWQQ